MSLIATACAATAASSVTPTTPREISFALSLIHMPFGTALGIYTLWVLLPGDSEREYQRLSRVA